MIIVGRTEFTAVCPICKAQYIALANHYMHYLTLLHSAGWFTLQGQYYCEKHTEQQARLFWKEVWIDK